MWTDYRLWGRQLFLHFQFFDWLLQIENKIYDILNRKSKNAHLYLSTWQKFTKYIYTITCKHTM